MGTETSYNNEWIELYNNTNENINLDGWILKGKDGSPQINLAGIIPANGFFLLERTNDNTLPDISADQIYKGALDNKGENLGLYDNFGSLIDLIDCSSGWFAGDKKTKQTMERKSGDSPGTVPENWQTSQNPGGTPKTKNSLVEEPTQAKPVPTQPEESDSPPLSYPSNVFINEILPSPEGPGSEEEWIEIFNENKFEVATSGWEIQDTTGKTNTYTFPKETKISANGFLVLKRETSKIILNNDGDGLKLINPAGKIVDEVSYPKAEKGKSYNRINSEWVWSNSLTPGAQNIIPSQNVEVEKEKSPELTERKELAAVSEGAPKENIFPFFIACGIAIFSGIIILILKKTLNKFSKPVE